MRRVTDRRSKPRGFTLVEMVVAIVITGVLVALVSMFGRRQIDAYFDVAGRAALADAADTALRRIARDLQMALPNSVRTSGTTLVEFVPIRTAGRYRTDLSPSGGGDPLDLSSSTDKTFDVLGPPVTTVTGDQLVIYNLGQTGSDVYAGTSSRVLTTIGSSLSTLTFSGAQFTLGSPTRRFQVVGGPVSYECDLVNHVVRRHWCYNFQSTQPTVFGALSVHPSCTAEQSAILVDNVSACSITYAPGTLARDGLVTMNLTLQDSGGETVTLLHQVDILNAP